MTMYNCLLQLFIWFCKNIELSKKVYQFQANYPSFPWIVSNSFMPALHGLPQPLNFTGNVIKHAAISTSESTNKLRCPKTYYLVQYQGHFYLNHVTPFPVLYQGGGCQNQTKSPIGVQLGWDLVTVKVMAYDLHNFRSSLSVNPQALWMYPGRDHSLSSE